MLRRALVASLAMWALTTAVASAAVTVVPSEVEPGTPAQITFRVTNTRDAPTTKVVATTPFDALSVKSLAGWRHVEDGSTVTWDDGTIAPGEYADFDVAVASVPDRDIELTVTQTYDDGTVESFRPVVRVGPASHAHDRGRNGLAVLAIVLACVGIVLAAVAFMTRRTNPKDGPDQAPLP